MTLQDGSRLVFVKLGGSLITDKRAPEMARHDVIGQVAGRIAQAMQRDRTLGLVLGHGSGSFGHVFGQRYGTRAGVHSAEGWYGFAATADAAARLNRIVIAALLAAKVPAWSIQPGVALRCQDGRVEAGPDTTVAMALDRGLVPVVFGDVALDSVRGGTIASTEEIFEPLVASLHPHRLVLAGEVDGIYTADPLLFPDAQRIPLLTSDMLPALTEGLGGSYGVDVTGGMRAKVQQAMAMVQANEGLEIVVCSALRPGALVAAMAGEAVGTRIRAS